MEATKLNFSVEIPSKLIEETEIASFSKGAATSKPKRRSGTTTLAKVIRYIEAQNFSKEKKAQLIQKAKNCPSGALFQFCQNIK